MAEKIDFVGLGFCSNDYLAVLPHIPMDSKVQILEHLIQGGGPGATSTVAAARGRLPQWRHPGWVLPVPLSVQSVMMKQAK